MKNILLLLLPLVSFLGIQAQTLPNNDFESWENMGLYEDPEFWDSPNKFTALMGTFSVTKSTDAFSGSYSARLETIELFGGSTILPGLLTLADFSIDFIDNSVVLEGGFFLQENVAKLTGVYKYSGVNGDSASVFIYNYRHPEGEEIDSIGAGGTFLHDAADWTPFEVYMINQNNHVPDTFNVIIVSSAAEEAPAGSVLYIDSLVIETNTGIINLWNPSRSLHVYPNPASNRVTFEAGEQARQREILIYDPAGRLLKRIDFNGTQLQLDVSAYPSGLLTYSVLENGKRLYGGSFLKK